MSLASAIMAAVITLSADRIRTLASGASLFAGDVPLGAHLTINGATEIRFPVNLVATGSKTIRIGIAPCLGAQGVSHLTLRLKSTLASMRILHPSPCRWLRRAEHEVITPWHQLLPRRGLASADERNKCQGISRPCTAA